MKDRDFLIFIHEKLDKTHGENTCFDYMHKLKEIIKALPTEQETLNCCTVSCIEDLLKDDCLKKHQQVRLCRFRNAPVNGRYDNIDVCNKCLNIGHIALIDALNLKPQHSELCNPEVN